MDGPANEGFKEEKSVNVMTGQGHHVPNSWVKHTIDYLP